MTGKPAEIILHIGPHKTGTTSLQAMFGGPGAGAAAGNIYYPVSGRRVGTKMPGHHGIPVDLRAGRGLSEEFLKDIHNAPKGSRVVISSENFTQLKPGQIQRLKVLEEFAPVKVIYFARRADGLMPSKWQETIKHGSSWTWRQFAALHWNDPAGSSLLNYCIVLDRWAGVFGKSAVQVVSYDNLRVGGDLFVENYFLSEILKIDTAFLRPAKRNLSNQPEKTELLRVLNEMKFGGGPGNALVRQSFNHYHSRLVDPASRLLSKLRQYLTYVPAPEPEIMNTVEQLLLDNYRANLMNPTADGRLFAPEDPVGCGIISLAYRNDQRLVQELQDLFAELFAPQISGEIHAFQ